MFTRIVVQQRFEKFEAKYWNSLIVRFAILSSLTAVGTLSRCSNAMKVTIMDGTNGI